VSRIEFSVLSRLAGAVLLAGTCLAQTPDYYKTVSRVTWVVENIDRVRPLLEKAGLANIQEFPNIQLVGTYRGKPVTIYAWQITGHLGNLTVDVIQPGEGQANAYTAFLSKHGDGILSIVHEAPNAQTLEREIQRMKGKGCEVLQQVMAPQGLMLTYFDTEPNGKFVLGLAQGPDKVRATSLPHFGLVARDDKAASAYWQALGFPQFTRSPYEWTAPLPNPGSIYREGIDIVGGVRVESMQRR
jgi:hypothetical protein